MFNLPGFNLVIFKIPKNGLKWIIIERYLNVVQAIAVPETMAGIGGEMKSPRYASKILFYVFGNVCGDGLGSPFFEALGSIEIIHCPDMPFIGVLFDALDIGPRNVTA